MNANIQEIHPGKGLGALRFGMSQEQVKQIIGDADEVERYSLDELEGDDTEAWHYDEAGISVSFDEEYDWRMSSIAVSLEDYLLDGEALIGKSVDEVLETAGKRGWGTPEEDAEIAEEDAGVAMFHLEDKGISFWFEDDVLSEIQLSPLVVNDEVSWPEL